MTAPPIAGSDGPPATLDGRRLALALAAFTVLLHFAVNLASPYGFQRDEFLYFGMGQHLRFWRMDFPPLIAVVANVERGIFGESMLAMRLASALAGGAIVYVAMRTAHRLGGRRVALALTALALLTSVLYLRAANLFQPVILDQLWWTLGLYTLIRLRQTGGRRWWLVLGVVGGIGLLTKFSILFFGFSILVALVLGPERRELATRWPWLTLLIALAIGSPGIVGQLRLGFPVIGQLRDLQSVQLAHVTPFDFVVGQFLLTGPAFFLAVAAVAALLLAKRWAHLRVVGWTALAAFATLLLLHGKHYYLGPIYPVLIGVGAVFLEGAWDGWRRRALLAAFVVLQLGWGALLWPVGLPLLAPERMEAYTRATGLGPLVNGTNTGGTLRLPQDYADMLGWEDRVEAVARVYASLDPVRRTKAVIISGNWGEAGALDFFGPRHGLPGVISPSGSYWFFGPGTKRAEVAVTIGISEEGLRRYYGKVTAAAHLTNTWTVREEQDLTVYVCEDPRGAIQDVWPTLAGRN
jgi:4-amino-4-deoxy-L-arabinose transferase-like glycosyltransferase